MLIEPAYLSFIFSDAADIINAVSHLIEVLVGVFGRTGTGILVICFVIGSIAYRRYREYRKDSAYRAVLAEKERTIQRLAEESRNYRIVILKAVAGWTDDEIDRFVMKNEFVDGVVARKALEGEEAAREQPPQEPPPQNRRAPRGRRRS